MPPAIHRRMQVSAVGLGCSTFSPATSRGAPPASVVSAAALRPRRKSRRVQAAFRARVLLIAVPRAKHEAASPVRRHEAEVRWTSPRLVDTQLRVYNHPRRSIIARKRRTYTPEFKAEAVQLVTERGYSVAEAARSLGVHETLL